MVPDGEEVFLRQDRWVGILGMLLLVAVPLVYFPHGFRPFLWSRLLVVQVGAALLAGVWVKGAWQGRARTGWFAPDVPAVLYLILTAFSFWMAVNPFKSGLEVVKLATFIGLYFAISRTVRKEYPAVWVRVIAGVTACVSIIGIAQYLGIAFLGIPSGGYPSATFLYRNFLAMYLIMALPLAAVPFLLARRVKAELLWGLAWALPCLMLIYTRTRGAWVGLFAALLLAAGILFAGFRNRSWPFLDTLRAGITRRKVLVAFLFLAGVALAAWIPPRTPSIPESNLPPDKIGVFSTASSILKGQDSGRLPLWRHTLDLVGDYWLFGAGIGNWEVLYPKYAKGDQLRPGFTFARPHNDYLWIASELGIPGLLVYLWLLIAALGLILRTLRKTTDLHTGLMLMAAGISILAISGHACFSFPRERIPPGFLFWFLLGVVACISRKQGPVFGEKAGRWETLVPVFCTVVILAGMYPAGRSFLADWAYRDAIVGQSREDWEGMKAAAQRSVEWGVWDYRIYLLKSEACLKLGDLQGALEASRACLTVHPNSISAHQNMGKIAAALNDLEQSRDAYVNALALDPDNAGLYRDLGVVYRRLDRPDEALAAYREAFALQPGNKGIRYNVAELYRMKGDLDAAEEEYGAIVRQNPEDAPAYMGLGEIWQMTGKKEAAIAAYQEAARLAPEVAEPYYNLGELYREEGLIEPAVRMYRAFLERWRGDPAVAAEVRRRIGTLER